MTQRKEKFGRPANPHLGKILSDVGKSPPERPVLRQAELSAASRVFKNASNFSHFHQRILRIFRKNSSLVSHLDDDELKVIQIQLSFILFNFWIAFLKYLKATPRHANENHEKIDKRSVIFARALMELIVDVALGAYRYQLPKAFGSASKQTGYGDRSKVYIQTAVNRTKDALEWLKVNESKDADRIRYHLAKALEELRSAQTKHLSLEIRELALRTHETGSVKCLSGFFGWDGTGKLIQRLFDHMKSKGLRVHERGATLVSRVQKRRDRESSKRPTTERKSSRKNQRRSHH